MSFALISDGQIISRIADGCKKKRLLLGITQEVLAKKSNVSMNTVKKFERGEPPSLKTLISILRALGEIDRTQELIPDYKESPEDIFRREQLSRPVRKRARRERN